MKYNKQENIQETTFHCIHELISDMVETVMTSEDEYAFVTVACNQDLAEDLIKTISNTTINGFEFYFGFINFDTNDYEKEYYITINSDGELSCEKAWHEDNEYHKEGYLYTVGEVIYVFMDEYGVEKELIDALKDNNILLFDFAEDNECDD